MKLSKNNARAFRQLTAVALVATTAFMPAAASAGFWDNAKSKVKNVTNKIVAAPRNIANDVRQSFGGGNGPFQDFRDLFDQIQEMKEDIEENVKGGLPLLKKLGEGYREFAGPNRCDFGSPCHDYRENLRSFLDDFGMLAMAIPAVAEQGGVAEHFRRVQNLIDYIPPRALYMSYQVLGPRMPKLMAAAAEITALLTQDPVLPKIENIIAGAAEHCPLLDKTPGIELLQHNLKSVVAVVKYVEFIPNVEIKVHVGGEAGIAVANASAEGGVAVGIQDIAKLIVAPVIITLEVVDRVITRNLLRAKTFCRSYELTHANR